MLIIATRSKAWVFDLESMTPISKAKVNPAVQDFVERMKFTAKTNDHQSTWNRFVSPVVTQSIRIIYSRLDKVYEFGIKETGYILQASACWYPDRETPVWCLSISHKEWPSHLAELTWLCPGEVAQWGDVISTFFPDDGISSYGMSLPRKNSGQHGDVDDIPLDGLNLEEEYGPTPSKGVRLLMDKLMQLSKIVNAPNLTDIVPDQPRLGAGLTLRNWDLLD